MEAGSLMRPEFWAEEVPLVMGESIELSLGLPGLVYFRSSGTTGEPKWIGLRRSALLASAAAVNRHLEVDSGSVWALALPLIHVGGFGVIARAHQATCGLEVFTEKWSAVGFGRWLKGVKASHLSLVPTQVHDLVISRIAAPETLRAVVVGGGALDASTGRAARALGWPVLASYGMTEAGSQIATQGLEKLETAYVTDALEILPCWQLRRTSEGRLEMRGDALFEGWLVNEDGIWRYRPREGDWFVTSDTGDIGPTGLRITGRADTSVKILGELVNPLAVETKLRDLAGMPLPPTSLCVVAVPEARAGMRLVLAYNTECLHREQAESLLDRYHSTCPGYCRISSTLAMPALPSSPLGKLLRGELAKIASEKTN